jgi:hypothetical protein
MQDISAEEQLVALEKEIVKVSALSKRIVTTLGKLEEELTAEWLRIRGLIKS